ALATCIAWLAYSTVYILLLNATWVLPIPRYLEHGAFALYLAAAVAGYWGMRNQAASVLARIMTPLVRHRPAVLPAKSWRLRVTALALVLLGAVIAAKVGSYGLTRAQAMAKAIEDPWANEPEFIEFLAANSGVAIGRPFRGAVNLSSIDPITLNSLAALWARDVPSLHEYSQLVTPEALYFVHALRARDV